jgi:hypothetical protein
MPVAVSAVVTTLLLSTREYSHETVDPARKVRYDESDRPCILSSISNRDFHSDCLDETYPFLFPLELRS